jgi:transposase-like protein
VDRLEGPAESKQRLRVILTTLTGELSVAEACRELGISETRLLQLRHQALEGALAALLPGPPGRPAQDVKTDPEREAQLTAQVRELEHEVVVEQVRAEIALTAPQLLKRAAKKNARRRKKRRQGDKRPVVAGVMWNGWRRSWR